MKDLKISQANQDDIAVWKNLQRYPAWKKVITILEERVKQADAIINQIGGDREVEFTKRDVAIIKKNSYLDLIELPEKMIEQLSGTGVLEEPEEMDPFAEGTDRQQSFEDDDF